MMVRQAFVIIFTVIYDVLPVNDPPGVPTVNGKPVTNNVSDSITTPEDTPIQICMQWIEYEGGTSTAASSLGTPFHGSLQGFSDGDSCFTYLPDPDYHGLDTLRILLCDNSVPPVCDTLIIPIVVTPVNDPPNFGSGGGIPIVNDTIKTIVLDEDTPTLVCFNGTDVDGDSLDVFQLISAPNHGTATEIATGDSCFLYTPALNYSGPDTLTISVCDNGSPKICQNITVIFDIQPVNDPPIAPADTLFIDAGMTESVYVLGNDSDVETSHPNLTFSISSGPFLAGATATIVNDSIRYTAPSGAFYSH